MLAPVVKMIWYYLKIALAKKVKKPIFTIDKRQKRPWKHHFFLKANVFILILYQFPAKNTRVIMKNLIQSKGIFWEAGIRKSEQMGKSKS